jgi:AsmA-like C-terminal region
MGPAETNSRRRKLWRWVGISALLAVAVLAVVGEVMVHRAAPILKGRVIETLSTEFNSKVELDGFDASVLKGFEVDGSGLRIFPPDDVMAAGAGKPLIAIRHFTFHSNLAGLFIRPMHVGTVEVEGLVIDVPPKTERRAGVETKRRKGRIKIVVDAILCRDSRLLIESSKPEKDPKDFELEQVEMHNVGPNQPWRYQATLTNAVPKGEIQANGLFGPWQTEAPGDSAVLGHYTFDGADLGTIKGIGGTLSSAGNFSGQLNRIAVQGTTRTPDFSIDTANHPMPLETSFDALVDGTTGDTYLNQIDATLGQSRFTTHGAVITIKGQGHQINLDAEVPGGRTEDFLALAVKTQPAIMTGQLGMRARLQIRPGKQRVAERLGMQGDFSLAAIHFTNPEWEDKVDMLSLRAQGDPKDAKPGAADVHSGMTGRFVMDRGELRFSSLKYTLPGADVDLAGVYSMDGDRFDFTGTVRTKAKLSQMVASRWKSLLLKPVDPFFNKNGAGAQIPVKISGTRGAPKFGLDLHHKGGSGS